MADPESDIVLNDDGTIDLVGRALHLKASREDSGFVTLDGNVLVARPRPPPRDDRFTKVADVGGGFGGTRSLGSLLKPLSAGIGMAAGPGAPVGGALATANFRLRQLRKEGDAYPLHETLDVLVTAVLELIKRSSGSL